MTAGGVIPPPEERAKPQLTGRMTGINGIPVDVSVNLDGTVRIQTGGAADFDREKAEEFARLFVAAVWLAAEMPP